MPVYSQRTALASSFRVRTSQNLSRRRSRPPPPRTCPLLFPKSEQAKPVSLRNCNSRFPVSARGWRRC
eukprot:scaffold2095_cov95-Pinguiococcus_pyrenoidosus.AAC.1